jgi:hypothetical protein
MPTSGHIYSLYISSLKSLVLVQTMDITDQTHQYFSNKTAGLSYGVTTKKQKLDPAELSTST